MVLTRACKQNRGAQWRGFQSALYFVRKPAPERRYIWDDTLPGFGLQVLPNRNEVRPSSRYRTTDRRDPRRATIGKVGSLTPDQAREIAEEVSRKVKSGGDPLDDKRKAREALTVGQLLDAYLASETFADKADTNSLDRHRSHRASSASAARRSSHQQTAAGRYPSRLRSHP